MEPGDLTGVVLDGRYRVIEPVAEGAMGVVYRAERVKLGRVVAIKVLHDSLPNELRSRQRFELEAMAMAKLEHPHCAAVVDVGIYNDQPFVVMDFVSGPNLKEVIAQGPMPIARAVEIIRQVLSGLAHAHEHGIIHRDVKPANIVLSQKAGLGDHVKILDFGLARLNKETSNLTTGIVVGTPSYMAPEQIRGIAIDCRADIYACGVLLFELLTGRKPFISPKDDPIEVCSMHLKKAPPRLADIRPGEPFGELEAIVARALSKMPDERYATAVEMAAALDLVVPRRSLSTPPVGVAITMPVSVAVGAGSAPNRAPSPVLARASTPPPPVTRQSTPVPPPPAREASTPPPAREPSGEQSTARPPLPVSRRQLAIAGLGVLALVVVIAVVASGGGTAKPQVGSGSPKPTPHGPGPSAPEGDPASEIISRANDLLADGHREAALDMLVAARKSYPDDARLAYQTGQILFAKLFWTDGLKQLRDAVRLDASYRDDPELIKTVLRGFNTTPRYNDDLADFLHDVIGPAAKPFLEETAAGHPNPTIRARAADELRRYP